MVDYWKSNAFVETWILMLSTSNRRSTTPGKTIVESRHSSLFHFTVNAEKEWTGKKKVIPLTTPNTNHKVCATLTPFLCPLASNPCFSMLADIELSHSMTFGIEYLCFQILLTSNT